MGCNLTGHWQPLGLRSFNQQDLERKQSDPQGPPTCSALQSLRLAFPLRALRVKCDKGTGLGSSTPFWRPLSHSHLFLPSHVTYVHRALGQLSHHENRSNALPLGMGHNGEVGRPGLKMLGRKN